MKLFLALTIFGSAMSSIVRRSTGAVKMSFTGEESSFELDKILAQITNGTGSNKGQK